MQTHANFFSLPHHKSQYLSYLYTASVLRTFVLTSFGIFLPILLIKHFLYLGQATAILVTIFYFAIYYGCHLLIMPFASIIAAKCGVRICALAGEILLMFFFLFIGIQLYLLGFIFLGLACGLWWFAYHTFFLEIGKNKTFGKQVGFIQALSIFTGVIAPLVGGFLLEFTNKQFFYGYAVICVFLSLFSILFFKDFRQVKPVTFLMIWKEITFRPNDFISIIGHGGELSVYAVAWPLLLFLVFKDFLQIAIFSSVIMVVAALLAYSIGKLLDGHDKNKIKKIGIMLTSSSWIGKAIFQTPIFLYIFDVLYQLLSSFLDLPMTVIAYQHALTEQELYIAFREVSYRIGNILGLLCLAIIIFLHLPLWFIFVYAALVTFLSLKLKV